MRIAPSLAFTSALLALATFASARPVTQQTIPELAKKADYLLVGQVLKITDVGEEQSDTYKMPVIHKRATIRILRGIKSSDASAADAGEVTVDYFGLKADSPPDSPMFPQLAERQIALFPVKRVGEAWRFVDEEDAGMIAPAVPQEISAGWPANVDGNIAFVYRELAGAALYGDFATMSRVGRYVDSLGPTKEQPVDYIFALMKAEIGDNLLREDSRWFTIGTAAYIASGTPRPSLDALINGMAAQGGGAARAPTDALPSTAALRLAALTLRKAARMQLSQRILMLLISHQEDPGLHWGVAKALVDNFTDGPMNGNVPMLVSMEDSEFRRGKSGALYVADFMVKDATHPLAAAAVAGARQAIGIDGDLRDMPRDVPFTPELRQAEGLILRAGTDDDFKFLLHELQAAREDNPRYYQAMLLLAGDSELSPPERVLDICRRCIDDETALKFPPYPGFRVNDLAALTAARIGKQDFGLSPTDPPEKRDAAIAKAAAWLQKPAETK